MASRINIAIARRCLHSGSAFSGIGRQRTGFLPSQLGLGLVAGARQPGARYLSLWPSSKKAPETSELPVETTDASTSAAATPDPVVEAESISPSSSSLSDSSIALPSSPIDSASISDTLASSATDAIPVGAIAWQALPEGVIPAGLSLITPIQHLFAAFSAYFPALPGWELLLIGSFGFRMFLFPLALSPIRNGIKLLPVQPQLVQLRDEMNEAQAKGDKQRAMIAALKSQKLMKEAGVSPLASLGNAVGVGVPSILSFFAVRRFLSPDAPGPVPGMVTGGPEWCLNLTGSDPTFILPGLAVLALQAQFMVLKYDTPIQTKEGWQPHLSNIMGMMMLVSAPALAWLPSGMFFYFIGTSMWGVLQSLLLRIPSLRRVLRLPPRPKVQPPSWMETFRKIQVFVSQKQTQIGDVRKGW